jgi:hypothetical protein
VRRVSLHVQQFLSVLVLSGVPYLFWIGQSYALSITNRSIAISTATPGAVAVHDFQFTPASTDAVGSIVFQYCANSPLFDEPCDPPDGLSASGAGLASQTANTGFSLDSAASNASKLVLKRAPFPMNTLPSSYSFTSIVNPAVSNQTTYVRISTYNSQNGSGPMIDSGSVAFTTSTNFAVGAFVPPFLNLCVGITVSTDCSQTAGDSIDLGILSSQTTRAATSQYAASTNDVEGCSVFVLGTTMTSGNNVIPGLNNGSASRAGLAEFGLNLRRNNAPSVGQEPDGSGTSVPSNGYNTPNLFSFVPGSKISGSTEPTAYNRMTVSYIANVPANQPSGVYATTLTYLASAQF